MRVPDDMLHRNKCWYITHSPLRTVAFMSLQSSAQRKSIHFITDDLMLSYTLTEHDSQLEYHCMDDLQ